jgi:hypothetical protein
MPTGIYPHVHKIKHGKFIKRIVFCEKCKKEINFRSNTTFCFSCARTGKHLSTYKGEKPKCLVCNKILSRYDAKRCKEHRGKTVSLILKERYRDSKNHPNYIDGRSKNKAYPQEFQNLREEIRKRDDYKCQNCGMTDEEHIIVYGTHIEVHHIDYNKTNNNKDNLLTLCKGCNIRANYNREYWQSHYSAKVVSRMN